MNIITISSKCVVLAAIMLLSSSVSCDNKKYVFIDGGACLGELTKEFSQSGLYVKYNWQIFAFEANPDIITDLKNNLENIANVKVVNKAISTENGKVSFFVTSNVKRSSQFQRNNSPIMKKTKLDLSISATG